MTKFSNKLKKTLILAHFWHFFPILEQKKIFPENPARSHTTHKFLAPCQISDKTNDTIPRKHLDGRTDRPYFIGPFWLLPGVQ